MNRFGAVGAMALGMTLGWACSGVSTKMLSGDPPDASAQDAGAGKSGIRVLEFECPEPSSVIEVTTDDLAPEEMMLARIWKCGAESSLEGEERPVTFCSRTSPNIIQDSTIRIGCGTVSEDDWVKAISVRVYAPTLH